MKKTFILGLLITLTYTCKLYAQPYLGLSGGNYSGIYNAYTNPAYIVDSRYLLHGNLFSTNVNVANNYISTSSNGVRTENLTEVQKNAYANVEVGMPSFYLTLEQKSPISRKAKLSLGFTARARTMFSINGVNKGVARVLYNRFDDTTIYRINYLDPRFEINTIAFTEYGLLAGLCLIDKYDIKLNLGVNVKLLNGYAGAYFNFNNAKFKVERKDTLTLKDLDVEYGHSLDPSYFDKSTTDKNTNAVGSGFSTDIGLIYEFSPDVFKQSYRDRLSTSNSNYLFRFGASIMDLGYVTFNNAAKTFKYSGDNFLSRKELESIKNLDVLDSLFAVKYKKETNTSGFTMRLPTMLNLTFDTKIDKGFYLNTGFYTNVPSFSGYGIKGQNIISFTPRFEKRNFEIAFPVAIRDYQSTSLGFMLKFGSIFMIGSDDIGGIILDDINSGGFFFGICIPIYRDFNLKK